MTMRERSRGLNHVLASRTSIPTMSPSKCTLAEAKSVWPERPDVGVARRGIQSRGAAGHGAAPVALPTSDGTQSSSSPVVSACSIPN